VNRDVRVVVDVLFVMMNDDYEIEGNNYIEDALTWTPYTAISIVRLTLLFSSPFEMLRMPSAVMRLRPSAR
jgi:hypothetical protein